MKRLIAAAVLAVLIGIIFFTGSIILDNVLDDSREILKQCVEDYEKNANATESVQKLEDYWTKKEGILSAFANHDLIDQIELAISSLKVYSNTDNKEFFYQYYEMIETLFHQLDEDNSVCIHSIF
ncbi:MAG: DUF4363 family protein [Acutalibacteraceae bacterium]|jgi:hypothetical protein